MIWGMGLCRTMSFCSFGGWVGIILWLIGNEMVIVGEEDRVCSWF
jgi:hypothetical protein